MRELLPCPFCGAQPEHDFFPVSHYPHEIYCNKCLGIVATQKKTFDEAANEWNRRAPAIPPDVRGAILVMRDLAVMRDAPGYKEAVKILDEWLFSERV